MKNINSIPIISNDRLNIIPLSAKRHGKNIQIVLKEGKKIQIEPTYSIVTDTSQETGEGFVLIINNSTFIYYETLKYFNNIKLVISSIKNFLNKFGPGSIIGNSPQGPITISPDIPISAQQLLLKIEQLEKSIP